MVDTLVDKPEEVKRWKEAGVQDISYSVDVGIFYDVYKDFMVKILII